MNFNRKERKLKAALVVLWLAAIVAANWSSAHWGPEASIWNAFFLIGLTLSTRDALHDLWGRNTPRNMAGLIFTGSALSYATSLLFASEALPSDVVARIALASCVALAVAETADAILYHVLRRREWLERSNTSNVLSSALDSVVFVWIAFGADGFLWAVMFGQFTAKIAGGFLWSLVLKRRKDDPYAPYTDDEELAGVWPKRLVRESKW